MTSILFDLPLESYSDVGHFRHLHVGHAIRPHASAIGHIEAVADTPLTQHFNIPRDSGAHLGVADYISRRDFNSTKTSKELCTCHNKNGDNKECPVTQHLAVGHRSDIGCNDIQILMAYTQLGKGIQTLARAYLGMVGKGLLPIITTRNNTPDVTRFMNSIQAFNKMLADCPSNADGLIKLVGVTSARDLWAHIESKTPGLPVLLILHNAPQLKSVRNTCAQSIFPRFGKTSDEKYPIALMCDEGDLTLHQSDQSSVIDKEFTAKPVDSTVPVAPHNNSRYSEIHRQAWEEFFPTRKEDEDNFILLMDEPLFEGAAEVMFITSTPAANVINNVKTSRPGGKIVGYMIDLISEYHGISETTQYQDGDIAEDRRVRHGLAAK